VFFFFQTPTFSLKVFQSKDRQFTCIQQRSPTLKGKRSQYIAMLTDFSQHFDRTVIVTSMDAARRLDSQINSPVPFRTLGIHMEGVAALELEEQEDKIPGSGLAMHLYKALKAPSLAVMFALEGDNVQDSIEYANFINTLLKIKLGKLNQKGRESFFFFLLIGCFRW
jgi:proteasome assembly chaperone 2